MKLYLVHGFINKEGTHQTFARWCGSQADCASARKEFTSQGAKRADITTDEVEITTTKAGLLEFLNKQAEG